MLGRFWRWWDSGRTTRRTFWVSSGLLAALAAAGYALNARFGTPPHWPTALAWTYPLVVVVSLVHFYGSLVGRLHDMGRSRGWLFAVLPFAHLANQFHRFFATGWMKPASYALICAGGAAIVLFVGLVPGQPGENHYGPDPRDKRRGAT